MSGNIFGDVFGKGSSQSVGLPGLDELSVDGLSGGGFGGAGFMDNSLFSSDGQSGDVDWGTLFGAQGGGGGMQMQQAQQQQQPNPLNTLSSLMGMVGKPQQQPRPGQAYQSPYIQSLMNI